MKHLVMPLGVTAPLIIFAASILALLTALITPVYASIACPLATDQMSTYSCGCNPPRLEGLEPADILPKNCTYPCPLTNNNLQSQSVACRCPTYCRVDSTTATGTAGNALLAQDSTSVQATLPPLTTDQLTACQKAAPKINILLESVIARDQRQLSLFSSIAQQAENFYSASGKTTSSYSTLVSAVNNAKQDAEAKIVSLKGASGASFDCSQNDPKSAAGQKLTDAKATISSLQSYRAAVKNLIAGIKSAERANH